MEQKKQMQHGSNKKTYIQYKNEQRTAGRMQTIKNACE
jgi:hypothetical protein